MYNVRNSNIFKNWNKKCYIALRKQEQVKYDDYGNEVNSYFEPKEYYFNIQPVNGYFDIVEYGEKVDKMYKAIISYEKYNGVFHEGDIAYLEGKEPENENSDTYGSTGNFVISSVRPQNLVIAIYFERIQK